jgi:putative transcriptional regulator
VPSRQQNPLDETGVRCRLDELLAARELTLVQLSELVGVSVVNLSILKNDRARAIRFSTLTAICRALSCDIGDLLTTTSEPHRATIPTRPHNRPRS